MRTADRNSWAEELDLLNGLAGRGIAEFDARRQMLSDTVSARDSIFWSGRSGLPALQRDFVYLDTSSGTRDISQADVFAVVTNLFAAERSGSNDLTKKPQGAGAVPLRQSVYGHILLTPEAFTTFNDSVLKATHCFRKARRIRTTVFS